MSKFARTLLQAFLYEPWLVVLCAGWWTFAPMLLFLSGKALWLAAR